ncbi:MAG: type II CAAX endopeptidase family protein [Bacteroidota bacterium]
MSTVSKPSDHPWAFLLLLFFAFLVANLIGFLLADQIWGGLQETLSEGEVLLDQTDRQVLRYGQIIIHFFSFTITSVLVGWLAYKAEWLQELGLTSRINIRGAGSGILLLVFLLPVASVMQYINVQLDLSEAALQQEALSNNLLRNVVLGESMVEFITLFIAVAILPALGEELLFRGLIQGKILPLFIENKHLQVILAGLLFSVMHLEMAGILPRWILGIAFGYAFLWSQSLWAPILMHLTFNGIQAVSVYSSGEFQADTEVIALPQVVWILAGAGLLASIWLIRRQSAYDRTYIG